MRCILILIGCVMSGPTSAAGLAIDLNPDFKRGDILSQYQHNWTVADAMTATTTVEGITFTLKSEAKLIGTWWKPGFDYPARMASDGVVSTKPIEITIRGLPAGKHTLATFHNAMGEAKLSRVTLRIGEKTATTEPSLRVQDDEDAASAFVEFEVTGGETVFTLSADEGAVVLNGLELDRSDPSKRAKQPTPVHHDEHTAENPKLTWQPAAHAKKHRIHFGTSPDKLELLTETTANEFDTAPRKLDTHTMYYWRVDTVHADGVVTGNVWQFRVRQLAFPGAEGYGRFAIGGRSGKVFEVTNLNDSGPGSLRDAVEAKGPRMVVFRVGGIIELNSKLVIRNPYITIAGQTAPGDGICLKGYTFGCSDTHDVIIRHIRIRVGDVSGTTQDGCGARGSDHIIFDHCSISWSIDEGFSSREGKNITVQRCIIAEALNIADHKKYQPGKGHSFAGSISGGIGSFHHNLLAHCTGRNWSLAGGLDRTGQKLAGKLDIRNNVVYNWQNRTTDGGVRELNFVGNYYLPGPATKTFTLLKPDPNDWSRGMKTYIIGNVINGQPDINADNWKGFVGPTDGLAMIRSEKPIFEPFVTTHTAEEAFDNVIVNVGANRPRIDVVDRRVLANVRLRNHTYSGVKGKLPGIIDSQNDAGGWPSYDGGDSPTDTDHDGIPDAWETKHGLTPNDATDGAKIRPDGYSNLEVYLNELAVRPSEDATYRETIRKRAIGVVEAAKLSPAEKNADATRIVEAHYLGIQVAHLERDEAVKGANKNAEAIAKIRTKAADEVAVIHERFTKDLATLVTMEQADAIKDKMTYGVRTNTFRVYCEMLPKLTDQEKTKIQDILRAASEDALIAGDSNEKHEKFRLAKGKINNYLSPRGYDLKKASDEWAAKQRAKPKDMP